MRSNIIKTVGEENGERNRWRRFFLIGLFAPLLLSGCASSGVKDTTKTFNTVVIDPGHGGGDDGAKSRWAGREKNHNLDVAQRLSARLRAAGFKTVMTRQTDTFIPLEKRASISNRQDNSLFVSVHFNHSPSRRIRGAEVYYKSPVSRQVAQRILANIDAIPGSSARYVKTSNFRVLRLNRYPAVLVECGYLSNRGEGARCGSPAHRERLAGAIATALLEQRGKTQPTGTTVAAR